MNKPLFLIGLILTIAACSTEDLLAMVLLGVSGLFLAFKGLPDER